MINMIQLQEITGNYFKIILSRKRVGVAVAGVLKKNIKNKQKVARRYLHQKQRERQPSPPLTMSAFKEQERAAEMARIHEMSGLDNMAKKKFIKSMSCIGGRRDGIQEYFN